MDDERECQERSLRELVRAADRLEALADTAELMGDGSRPWPFSTADRGRLTGSGRAKRTTRAAERPAWCAEDDQRRSNRSRLMTLSHAATKSRTNRSFESSWA
jgi:hypothetical protein